MRHFIITCLCLLATANPVSAQSKEDAEAAKAIRAALPEAAALTETFAGKTKLEEFKNQPFTLVLVAIEYVKPGDPNLKILVRGLISPEEMSRIMTSKSKAKLASALNEEFIKGVTCKVKGDAAKGVVSFRVPGVWEGKVEYSARRGADGWIVEEFRLPTLGWTTTKSGSDGVWTMKKK